MRHLDSTSKARRPVRRWRAALGILLGTLMVAPPPTYAASDVPPSDERPAAEWAAPAPEATGQGRVARLIPAGEGLETARPTGDVEAAAPQNQLVTPGGGVFHRTPHAVHALRSVDVPGTAMQIYTWEEQQPDGTRRFYYAYSRAGVTPLGRARATSYRVRLRELSFDPLEDGQPAAATGLAAAAGTRLHLVQFIATPLPELRAAVEALGARVLRFLSDHTFLVEMDATARDAIAGLPYVRWVGPYHPEYRLERELRDGLVDGARRLPAQRYSIMLGLRGAERQRDVVALVKQMGGQVDLIEPAGLRVEATLTADQLARLAHADEVQFIDRWGGPGETDMDVVREVGGANYVEALQGWTGQGVRGEVFDTELLTTHQEWSTPPLIHSVGTTGGLHGTSCYSINFARGAVAAARGMIPSAQGIFFRYSESTQFGGTKSRYDINAELIDPAGPYRAVLQTSSVGSTRVRDYTTISAEVDDYLFQHPILSTQSQSNAGNQDSRPQAWAKNIVSVGGMYHYNTADRSDDHWGFGASIGPAADGRIKPDLAYFYDQIHSATGSGNANYTQFGGTSAATPETAGHFGLLFQIWHNGAWAGHGGGADVFDSRPQMATAKALMINLAHRYDWTVGGPNGDIDRFKQGWGTADVRRLLDRAGETGIVDEADVLSPLGVKAYAVDVAAGESELNVTLAYTDPMGTVGAAQARINDLSLRVTSPTGTVYWGNNGLTAGNVSTPGGAPNTVDTVENVFVSAPAAGTWRVEVLGDEIVQDAHVETPEIDADYGLVVSGGRLSSDESLPLPPYSSTYSYPLHTRGYWFTAPTDFVIKGLQVPDETAHGLQNVEVVRFNPGVVPPTYTAATNEFTSLFRAVGLASSEVIPTEIPVYAGDVIGILGAAGDTSTMRNSYGNAPFVSQIFGQPVTLNRLGMQYNIAANSARDLWTSAGSLARVKMFYGPLGQAPLPPFAYTFSASWATRGYWFTAPTDFVITGLQVPDEAAHGLQNVEVVRFDPGVVPPAYASSTNAFTSLFRAVGQPSSLVVRTAIEVRAGDVIGILGAAGDAAMMHNSYGNAPFTSQIFGLPVTLTRLGMQFNLATNAARDVWTENASLARVKMFYSQSREAPLSAFSSTFSSPSLTRGFWFTAPRDFRLVGLQVPDESGHGLQNVELVRFTPGVVPPEWSGTTNAFTSVFRAVGRPSSQVVATSIQIRKGDVIGILGAAGDATTMRSSYGNGPFTSDIFGDPLTFTRMGMQSNLVTTPASNIWSQAAGSIGRVRLFYVQ